MKHLHHPSALLVLVLALFSFNCKWDKSGTPVPDTSGSNSGNGGGNGNGGNGGDNNGNLKDSVCFENEVLPILNTYCAKTGCHDAITMKEGYNLSDYNDIMWLVKPGKPNDSKLIEVMTKNGEDDKMPPPGNPSPTSDQITLIEQWITEGAQVGIDCNTGSCDTTNVTYTGTIVPILQSHCYGCHSSGAVILTSYNNLMVQVNNGKLWGDINWNAGFTAMPLGGPKLTDCDLNQIGAWINAGALNN